jgi:hypothetical protein
MHFEVSIFQRKHKKVNCTPLIWTLLAFHVAAEVGPSTGTPAVSVQAAHQPAPNVGMQKPVHLAQSSLKILDAYMFVVMHVMFAASILLYVKLQERVKRMSAA